MPYPKASNLLRGFRCLHTGSTLRLSRKHPLPVACRTLFRRADSAQHIEQATFRSANQKRNYLYICLFATIISAWWHLRPLSNDAPSGSEISSLPSDGTGVEVLTEVGEEQDEVDQAATGTSTVPFFPRKIYLPRSGAADDRKSRALPAGLGAIDTHEEYQLLGLGIRTVSFLSIEVYVVGIYVAASDLGNLQAGMVRAIAAPGATTLVEGEKEELKRTLVNAEESEKIWGTVLEQEGIKSALRIVPTRGTAFGHLRDGWVRGITARGKKLKYEDEGFRNALGDFKGIFGGAGLKGLEKGKGLLLGRGGDGELKVWMERERVGGQRIPVARMGDAMAAMGSVKDERISRLLWLGYLAGGTVASEGARRSVIEGVMDLVVRPIGTVETRVI